MIAARPFVPSAGRFCRHKDGRFRISRPRGQRFEAGCTASHRELQAPAPNTDPCGSPKHDGLLKTGLRVAGDRLEQKMYWMCVCVCERMREG